MRLKGWHVSSSRKIPRTPNAHAVRMMLHNQSSKQARKNKKARITMLLHSQAQFGKQQTETLLVSKHTQVHRYTRTHIPTHLPTLVGSWQAMTTERLRWCLRRTPAIADSGDDGDGVDSDAAAAGGGPSATTLLSRGSTMAFSTAVAGMAPRCTRASC